MPPPCARRLIALLLVVVGTPSLFAGAREDLLRHVPDDIGFCLILHDLREHSAQLEKSPFAEMFRESTVGQGLVKSDELKQLTTITHGLEKFFGVSVRSFADDIIGDCVIFVYRPGPPGKPDQEQGLVMLQARNEKLLADLVNRVNKFQKDTGGLVLEDKEFQGIKYIQRVERGKAPSFYCLNGSLFLFSGQEQMLQQALAASRQEQEPALTKRLRQAGTEGALLTLWINPRAFDNDVSAKAAAAAEKDARALRTFATCWKALDGIALSVRLDKDLSLELALQGRQADMPPALRRLLIEADRPSEMWPTFPDNALLSAAGRVDSVALLETLGELLPTAQRDELVGNINRLLGDPFGRDFVKELLPRIGPDWGLCVTAPTKEDADWFPRATLAVRVTSSGEKDNGQTERSLLEAVHFYAGLVVVGHNGNDPSNPLAVKRVALDQRDIKYLSGDKVFPAGLQPAFALHDSFLLFGTSPEALRRTRLPPTKPQRGPEPDGVLWIRLGIKQVREYIDQRRGELAQYLADKNNLAIAVVRGRLDQLVDVLQFVDRIEVRHRTIPGQVVFSLKVQTAKPLR